MSRFPYLSLLYTRGHMNLHAYIDADWGACLSTRRSVSICGVYGRWSDDLEVQASHYRSDIVDVDDCLHRQHECTFAGSKSCNLRFSVQSYRCQKEADGSVREYVSTGQQNLDIIFTKGLKLNRCFTFIKERSCKSQ